MSNQQFLHYLFMYCSGISSLLTLSEAVAGGNANSLPVIILGGFTTFMCDVM